MPIFQCICLKRMKPCCSKTFKYNLLVKSFFFFSSILKDNMQMTLQQHMLPNFRMIYFWSHFTVIRTWLWIILHVLIIVTFAISNNEFFHFSLTRSHFFQIYSELGSRLKQNLIHLFLNDSQLPAVVFIH